MNIFKRVIRIICYVFLVFSLGAFILVGLHDDTLEVIPFTYESNKISDTFKAVVVADLHHRESLKFPNTDLVSTLQKEEPDVVFLCGDLVDDWNKDLNNQKELFDGLNDIPTYYITGNHEHKSPSFKPLLDEINLHNNITFLDDEYDETTFSSNNVSIFGIHDGAFDKETRTETGKTYKTVEEQLEDFKPHINENKFNILLSHSPNYMHLYKNYGFDAVICGHTHGGQFRIGNWSPFTLLHGLNPYNFGEYIIDNNPNKRIYVTKGLGYSAMFPIRVNCRPDILSITFKK